MTRLKWTDPAVADLQNIRDYIGFPYSDSTISLVLNNSAFVRVYAAWPERWSRVLAKSFLDVVRKAC